MTDPRPASSTALWLALVMSAVGNSVISFASVPLVAHLLLGAVTVLCVAGLIALRHLRLR